MNISHDWKLVPSVGGRQVLQCQRCGTLSYNSYATEPCRGDLKELALDTMEQLWQAREAARASIAALEAERNQIEQKAMEWCHEAQRYKTELLQALEALEQARRDAVTVRQRALEEAIALVDEHDTWIAGCVRDALVFRDEVAAERAEDKRAEDKT